MTAQIVAVTTEVQVLKSCLMVAEQNLTLSQGSGNKNVGGVFDKKRLYPSQLKESSSFRSWAERFLSWLEMDNAEIAKAFRKGGKQEAPLDLTGLSGEQVAYSKAIYGHLRALTEVHNKAAKIVRLVKKDNGMEAWRRLIKKYDPQNPEVHTLQLEHIITYGSKSEAKSLADVPTALDVFDRILDDYEEATGDVAINDATKKTIMMQLCPPALRKATRDTIMAAQKTMKSVTPDDLHTIIVQRCEFPRFCGCYFLPLM